jgi:hypothetical protein
MTDELSATADIEDSLSGEMQVRGLWLLLLAALSTLPVFLESLVYMFILGRYRALK